MLIEVVDRDISYSYVIRVYEDIAKNVINSLPFKTKLNVWKHEVYFTTPFKIEGEANVYRVKLGEVYYWPPENSLCLFYGISEPYTPVIHVGSLVGPLYYLRYVRNGDRADVKVHEVKEEFKEVSVPLSSRGYDTASVLNGDVTALAASKNIGNLRISFLIFKERYGYHLESDALFKYSDDYTTLRVIGRVKEELNLRARYLRLDVNEDNYVVLTAGVNNFKDLIGAIEELESIYKDVINYIISPR